MYAFSTVLVFVAFIYSSLFMYVCIYLFIYLFVYLFIYLFKGNEA